MVALFEKQVRTHGGSHMLLLQHIAKRGNPMVALTYIKNVRLLRDAFFSCMRCFVEQLRQVKSTVHLTGTPTEETKEALKRLLQPAAANHVSYTMGRFHRLTEVSSSPADAVNSR